jgi:hypothetical protein
MPGGATMRVFADQIWQQRVAPRRQDSDHVHDVVTTIGSTEKNGRISRADHEWAKPIFCRRIRGLLIV